MLPDSLVQPLLPGPVDIVGDVHGEIEPLHALLRRLGYDEQGRHPENRRLVFVGDLTDRGPDSPAVVDLVQQLLDDGRAQCVLGNHDFNLLMGQTKADNGWFFGRPFCDATGYVSPQVQADEPTRQRTLALFRRLPVALERSDLRVVHSCWSDAMITIARQANDVVALYKLHQERIEADLADSELDDVGKRLRRQNENPVKRITSGPEERRSPPPVDPTVTRAERRVYWWNDYQDAFCVFGHYALPYGEPRGNRRTHCIDYGVAKRWTERRDGRTSDFSTRLAALRYPERVVVFDEADREDLVLASPG
ncbi:metallophosphoesterase [Lignipirellula cremea]|uniref:Bis(5'-nucleosyl)-tetraphosphatase PrpE [asymmetrical] n=1 Tax=Lignipirellula cremea TaxID=2528010 RepID=A0A518DZH8_9BACT|nr:metallophosphoesterase [Lignipirellula cremea]QDU97246.1 Bis(5'-nucleosyl)-tetraphosphatase PrpE [asymmetrical] [Lignipirellula cremea]